MSRAIIILGMHRSGTSCLTGSLEEAGLRLGRVNEYSTCNEKGTRENLKFMKLNDEVLAAHGASWDNPPPGPVAWLPEHLEKGRRLIAATSDGPVWGFKDPRTLFTLNGWLELLPDAWLVASFRNPTAVALSLNKRNKIPIERGRALWQAYNARLMAVRAAREVLLVNYDWSPQRYERSLHAICNAAGLTAPPAGFTFFENSLRHNDGTNGAVSPSANTKTHRRLQYAARQSIRTTKECLPSNFDLGAGKKKIQPLGHYCRQHRRMGRITPHSVRLFPKGRGATHYKSTGVAARCDWLIASDRAEPRVEKRRHQDTDTPRHIFLSMRSPFEAIQFFANEILPKLTSPFVLVSGSEDVTLPRQTDNRFRAYNAREQRAIDEIVSHPLLLRWFAENLAGARDDRFAPLPTGLVFEDNEAPSVLEAPNSPLLADRPLRALCGHRVRQGAQWRLRKDVSALASGKWRAWCTVLHDEIPMSEYFEHMRRHAFVLCVEGGGVDPSPKAWQAILNGAIPIVRRNGVSDAYRELPVAFIDDWSEDAITTEKLAAWRREFLPAFDNVEDRREVVKRLGLDYWWAKIEAAAHSTPRRQ